jgi:phenylacetate-CoA ligase
LPREALEALQLKRLQSQIERIYASVPYYRAKMDDAGVAPGDIKTLADIRKPPFTTKEDLRKNYPFGLFTVPLKRVVRIHASSGTTGQPTVVGYTKRDIGIWSELMARCLTAAGATQQDIIHNSYGYGLFTGGLGAHYGAENLGSTVIPVSGGNTKRQIMLMRDFRPGVAIECVEEQKGLHIMEDHFPPEIVHPETFAPLPLGEKGELVFTAVTKEAFPLIRYRTKDFSRLITDPCSCARTFYRMEKVTGRSDDMLIIRGVNVFPSQIEHVLISIEGVEPHYQIIVEREGTLDTMEVQGEVSDSIFSDEVKTLEGLTKKIQHEIKDLLGVSCKVKLVEPKSIQRSEGKAKRVIDKRKLYRADTNSTFLCAPGIFKAVVQK